MPKPKREKLMKVAAERKLRRHESLFQRLFEPASGLKTKATSAGPAPNNA